MICPISSASCAAYESEEHRHQIGRAVKAEAEDETQQAPEGEAAVGKDGEVDQRVGAAQGAVHESPAEHGGQRDQRANRQRDPSRVRRLFQADLEAGEGDRHDRKARQIETPEQPECGAPARQSERCGGGATKPGTTLIRNSHGQS